ncbi:WD40 repeat-like protein [Macrolepiota fuliginosa MF-IS2]|uniref:WD40 repeat-like protein n=1 Tax=Macrolepiota fuliginosa MF-IS2 TaxID=1400762 RepID=A0A9P5X886_9AGAR|nr:WD40 repeat-like protein [Macrolepiota fuliginosa MF-IS2]
MNPSHSDQTFNSLIPDNEMATGHCSHTPSTLIPTRFPATTSQGIAHPQASHPANSHAQTLYMPIESPPTPAPSPGPTSARPPVYPLGLASNHLLNAQDPTLRRQILASILASCTPSELLFISTTIAPLLKRDILFHLPTELSFHILSFIDDPRSLVRASQVSKHWYRLITEECVWRSMCHVDGFDDFDDESVAWSKNDFPVWREDFSYREHYKMSHVTMTSWRNGGSMLQSHRIPVVSPDNGTVTSLALDRDWIVVGLANSKILIFSAKTGVLARTLVGHDMGVWAVCLVSKGGYLAKPPADEEEEDGSGGSRHGRRRRRNEVDALRSSIARMGVSSKQDQYISPSLRIALGLDSAESEGSGLGESSSRTADDHPEMAQDAFPGKRSDNSYASQGWGQPNALVVSGGCDKTLRVWDIKTGYCIYVLAGHTSTVRCARVLHNRPIAVSGSRDGTVRVWDIQRGRALRILSGHGHSVRCLDVCGNRIVSGSYDTTCRVWDVDTGECLHILRGHFHEIYSVAFDGVRIASGGLDTTVRVWDARTGDCVALLQGHTALVCQLQLSPTVLATGGSDGRVITFDLSKYTVLHRIAAHDSSVTSLQFDKNFLVTGGNDGRVRLYETATGNFVRDLSDPSDTVWKVAYVKDICAIMCRRAGKTVMEIWSMKPKTL